MSQYACKVLGTRWKEEEKRWMYDPLLFFVLLVLGSFVMLFCDGVVCYGAGNGFGEARKKINMLHPTSRTTRCRGCEEEGNQS